MQTITVSASEMWDYFRKHKEELGKEEHIVAENDEFGVVITITEERGMPYFVVTADDYQYAEESAVSEKDCKETVEELYDKYLTGKFIDEEDYAVSLLTQEDMISERELELDDAIVLLVDAILECDAMVALGTNADAVCEDVKDHIIEYLARKHKLSIRRPMILEDEETGEDFFTEHPYECMVFEDEDNPIYK